MPRPPKWRIVNQEPTVTYFKPRGIPLRRLNEVTLTVEGLEALRLSDVEGLDQDKASAQMGISRQTFGRILANARKTVATAIVHGLGLRIEGGNYLLADQVKKMGMPGRCPRMSRLLAQEQQESEELKREEETQAG